MADMDPISRQFTNATAATAATATTGGRSHGDETIDVGCTKTRLSIPVKGVAGRDAPGLKWHTKEYSSEQKSQPRVLMIDFLDGRPGSGALEERVIFKEIHDLPALKAMYRENTTSSRALRVFHVQNCSWATKFLIYKFRIKDNDEIIGLQEFGDWLLQKKPQRRAGKPLLVGKAWRTTSDPWRGITKCSFGMDYMKQYVCEDAESSQDKEERVLGLMGYDSNDNAAHRYNVFSQRLSVYVQYNAPDLQTPGPDIVSPYRDLQTLEELYDNGNTIIVFDNSYSRDIEDTLIPARGEWESRWRRLPFDPHVKEMDMDVAALGLMNIITQDIFKALGDCWESLLDASWEHVSILEEKIYEQPADESRAPELWRNSARWLKYEKLMFTHIDIVNDMRKYLVDIDGDRSDEGKWLQESPEDYKRLLNLIEEDLVKRTNNLSELMYKSVAIRDSRQSLQLGTSMWRLSWVTFIFLPLTFISGFFGMNVSLFAGNPSIKWYFISVVPFMITVLLSWYILKHLLSRHRQTPQQRGIYEAFYTDLHNRRPDLWTRQGPRDYVLPNTRTARFKWWLMVRWAASNRIQPRSLTDDEPIGAWNRVKRYFISRWTDELVLAVTDTSDDAEMGLIPNGGTVADGLVENLDTAIGVAGVPSMRMSYVQRVDEGGDTPTEPVFEGRISGVMVEERRDTGELITEERADEGSNKLEVPNDDTKKKKKGSRG